MTEKSGSRLERLLGLLAGGSSLSIRQAAAKQIAAIARAHPQQIVPLIRQVHTSLRSREWEARVLAQGEPLLAANSQAYENPALQAMTPQERVAYQRQQLKKRLGLDSHMSKVVDTSSLVTDADLEEPLQRDTAANNHKGAGQILSEMTGLSARERNKLKRKLKQQASGVAGEAPAAAKRQKPTSAPSSQQSAESKAAEAAEDEAQWEAIQAGAWAFGSVCRQCCSDLVDAAWEVRHGAAVGLREVLRSQAFAAGVHADASPDPSGWMVPGGQGCIALQPASPAAAASSAAANAAWLEDCIVHLLCVLTLDRFGDYGSDQAVAPVRETVGQALGLAARALPAPQMQATAAILCQLAGASEWDVRQGGLLGLKFLLAATQADQAAALLLAALPAALHALQGKDDEVRAVAAEALLPVAGLLVQGEAGSQEHLLSVLWGVLADVDELSACTGSVMQLLSQLHCLGATLHKSTANLVLEADSCILQASHNLWALLLHNGAGHLHSLAPDIIAGWVELASTPVGQALRASLLLHLPAAVKGSRASAKFIVGAQADGSICEGELAMRMRLPCSQALGALACSLQGAQPNHLEPGQHKHVQSLANAILVQYTQSGWDAKVLLQGVSTQEFIATLTPASALALASAVCQVGDTSPLHGSAQQLSSVVTTLLAQQSWLQRTTSAALATAVAQAGQVPAKLNIVLQPLMGALRREADPILRSAVAAALANLVVACCARQPCPNDRLIKNLSTMVCSQAALSPGGTTVEEADAAAIAKQGAAAALQALVTQLGDAVPDKVPLLWTLAAQPLSLNGDSFLHGQPPSSTAAQSYAEALQVLAALAPALMGQLVGRALQLVPGVAACHADSSPGIRSLAVQCAVALAPLSNDNMIPTLLRHLLPLLGGQASQAGREGSVACMAALLEALDVKLAPFLFLVVVPLMGRMSDPSPTVRSAAAQAFATAVVLLPLAQGLPEPSALDKEQHASWHTDKLYLQQLLDNSQAELYELPVTIRAELRPYQREGINWLAFLRRCGLHGILADDMGLGKTLQATAIVAASHAEQDAANARPSLVAAEGASVVVMSYETLRSDVNWVAGLQWNYCVLDEGHLVRNPKSKIAQACRRVTAQHRLVLSGTPIQNSVAELWALFDFLMPGFLGNEAAFNATYGKALAEARTSKAGTAQAQAGLLAMDRLHRQVTPFILRRTKEAVLKDLPPKIIQDVLCQPSPLQQALLDAFAHSPSGQQLSGVKQAPGAEGAAPHVFQALQYLRRLCSHPLLALDQGNPVHTAAVLRITGADSWQAAQERLHALHHAPKLAALRDLLQQCGIVGGEGEAPAQAVEEAEPPNRVLVFAQLRSLLDLVEADLLKPLGVPFLRLDGGVEASQRFGIVQQFNADPTIPVMLLTTHVGGLGLNLTAANTVVFLEHDWNPMKDLQAMDRAHRLGQKRTVGVYRVLTRGTVEERIMGLQAFKLDVAATVVSQDNASMTAMDTGRLLDLLSSTAPPGPAAHPQARVEGQVVAEAAAAAAGGGAQDGSLKAVLAGLEELWDEHQYAEEFGLEGFMDKLSAKPHAGTA
ncbi:hypothetical protein WJX73_008453 [Symbiochloris irregularis]|uniref:Uncharacterized protein n=1 Tax=Symbiochloris irregularis TaxID=706552 RepID=A0AAW1PHM6_9CHLO